MIRKRTTCGAAISIAVLLSIGVGARAQTDADITAVTAANNAYYSALSTLDAAAMEKAWARESYIANVGPFAKAIQIGSSAVQDGFKTFAPGVAQLVVKPSETQVRINGNVAWTIGRETAVGKLKNDASISGENFVSNVFEKKDGRWLMVSHHAQRVPQ
jgi:ketosteroid isomerase-like protein